MLLFMWGHIKMDSSTQQKIHENEKCVVAAVEYSNIIDESTLPLPILPNTQNVVVSLTRGITINFFVKSKPHLG